MTSIERRARWEPTAAARAISAKNCAHRDSTVPRSPAACRAAWRAANARTAARWGGCLLSTALAARDCNRKQ